MGRRILTQAPDHWVYSYDSELGLWIGYEAHSGRTFDLAKLVDRRLNAGYKLEARWTLRDMLVYR